MSTLILSGAYTDDYTKWAVLRDSAARFGVPLAVLGTGQQHPGPTQAIRNGIDGPPVGNPWGGFCVIMSVVQQDTTDLDEEPKAATDQWIYHTIIEFNIKYRVAFPTLS